MKITRAVQRWPGSHTPLHEVPSPAQGQKHAAEINKKYTRPLGYFRGGKMQRVDIRGELAGHL